MKNHKLKLLGPSKDGTLHVPLATLIDVGSALLEGARRAARFEYEGESVRKGQRPTWLEQLCDIDVRELSYGSVEIHVDAPTLQGLPDFEVAELEDSQPTLSAIDRFALMMAAVCEDDGPNVLADRALLDIGARFARLAIDHGYTGIEISGVHNRVDPLRVLPAHAGLFERLRDSTPLPRAVRLFAKLDQISVTRNVVELRMEDQTLVHATLDRGVHDPDMLHALFDANVVVSGVLHYTPSGAVRTLIVESIGEASSADKLFAELPPVATTMQLDLVSPQGPSTGVNAYFGTWPGDESDDQLLRATRETA